MGKFPPGGTGPAMLYSHLLLPDLFLSLYQYQWTVINEIVGFLGLVSV